MIYTTFKPNGKERRWWMQDACKGSQHFSTWTFPDNVQKPLSVVKSVVDMVKSACFNKSRVSHAESITLFLVTRNTE